MIFKCKFYFLLIKPLTNCPISLGEVFFKARTTVTATAIEISVAPIGWILTIEPKMYPNVTPAIMARPEIPIYLIDIRSNQIMDSTDELAYAISVEKAAPRTP
jgi:hypothetical protein